MDFLNKVDLFKNLDRYEKLSLLDGLKAVWFDKGDIIVREGDIGDLFYIVEEGHVECLQMCRKNSQQSVQNRVIRKLTSGDHFGELALINNEKRTLTVKSGSEHVKLLTLDRKTFNRILGKIDKFLNRDYSDLVSFERAENNIDWHARNLSTPGNFINSQINESELEQYQWSENSGDIKDVLEDVDSNTLSPAEKSFETQRVQI